MSGNNGNHPGIHEDRRVRRTRTALVRAFNGLVMERPYRRIRVGDILDRAEVGRSTFYQHFRDKTDVLLHGMSPLLDVLADAVLEEGDEAALGQVLAHFWENRRAARELADDDTGPRVAARLATLIEERLAPGWTDARFPVRVVAVQIATAELGLIHAWLRGDPRCSPADLGWALRAGALGTLAQHRRVSAPTAKSRSAPPADRTRK